ncbi:hypothetical protein TCAL_16441 [Tigriopus californicus]|uniref:Uncharacterized protein n=1 Tax=Tigriopus californicus TaxID=6832 RepID=A0A553NYJ6_TIGCA|nr:hypothetical protein TCAL_16441 [Tigriopus californicus]
MAEKSSSPTPTIMMLIGYLEASIIACLVMSISVMMPSIQIELMRYHAGRRNTSPETQGGKHFVTIVILNDLATSSDGRGVLIVEKARSEMMQRTRVLRIAIGGGEIDGHREIHRRTALDVIQEVFGGQLNVSHLLIGTQLLRRNKNMTRSSTGRILEDSRELMTTGGHNLAQCGLTTAQKIMSG